MNELSEYLFFFFKNVEAKNERYKIPFYLISNRFPPPINNPKLNCFCNFGM